MNKGWLLVGGLFAIAVLLEINKYYQDKKKQKKYKLFGMSEQQKDDYFFYLQELCLRTPDDWREECSGLTSSELKEFHEWLVKRSDEQKQMLGILDMIGELAEENKSKKSKDGSL